MGVKNNRNYTRARKARLCCRTGHRPDPAQGYSMKTTRWSPSYRRFGLIILIAIVQALGLQADTDAPSPDSTSWNSEVAAPVGNAAWVPDTNASVVSAPVITPMVLRDLDLDDSTHILRAAAGMETLQASAGGLVAASLISRIQITCVDLSPGETKTVPLTIDLKNVAGLIFTLEWDPKVAVYQTIIRQNLLGWLWAVNDSQVGLGRLTIAIVGNADVTLTSVELARVTFVGHNSLVGSTPAKFGFTNAEANDEHADAVPFVSEVVCPSERFSLTWAASPTSSGTVVLSPSPDVSDGKYAPGTIVTITAVPIAGYDFGSWTGEASGGNPTTVTLNGNKTVTANFTLIPLRCALNVSVNPLGGNNVTITFATTPGYTYWVDYKDSLDTRKWTKVQPEQIANSTIISVRDPVEGTRQRFYRVAFIR